MTGTPRWRLVILLAMLAGVPGLRGQQVSQYKRFDIYILPEYDHPGVGIILAAEVMEGQYPRFLEMQVPAGTSTALLRQLGQNQPIALDIQERDGKTYLPIDVSRAEFQVQFYFNPFDETGARRAFEYTILTNELLPAFHVEVYRPIAASNFQHSLEGAEEDQDDLGLTFYRQHFDGLQPGTAYAVSVSYDNPTNMLTVPALQARLEELRAGETGAGAPSLSQPSNLSKVLIVLSLVGVGLFVILNTWGGRRAQPVPAAAESTSGGAVGQPATRPKDGNAKFCAKCGNPRHSDNRFCASCGKEF